MITDETNEIRGQAIGVPRDEEDEGVAGDDAAAELTAGTGENGPQHPPAIGAECDTDADLAGATLHGNRHQRVETGRGENHRPEQNAADDEAAEALRRLLLCDGLLECSDVPELQPGIDLASQRGDARRKRRCLSRDAHRDHDRIELRRRARAIDVRRPIPIGRDRPQIRDHADDLVPRPRLAPPAVAPPLEHADPNPHRIPAHHAHERLVDDDRPVRRPGVSGMQAAAGHDRARRTRRDSRHRQPPLRIPPRNCPAGEPEVHRPAPYPPAPSPAASSAGDRRAPRASHQAPHATGARDASYASERRAPICASSGTPPSPASASVSILRRKVR